MEHSARGLVSKTPIWRIFFQHDLPAFYLVLHFHEKCIREMIRSSAGNSRRK
jgi:phage-related protein